MKKINLFLRKSFDKKIDGTGLAVFRIFYSFILLSEIYQLNKFRHVIYDKDPYWYVGEINVAYLFNFWFIIIGLLFLGFFTRFATIVNYILGVIIFSSAYKFEYHVFYIYVGVNFLLTLMPVSRVFSLDCLIQKLKYSNVGKPYVIDRKVLEINYLAPVFVAIALVYFDSTFFKLGSNMWRDGLGVWLPSSLPMATWNDTSIILNQEIIIKFLGYFVIVFEALFIFLFWFRKLRVPLFLIGIFFHVGILITYPIPWFALTVIGAYLLLIPQEFWLLIGKMIKSKSQSYSFYFDEGCPLSNKIVVLIKHLDVFNKINCFTIQQYDSQEPSLRDILKLDLVSKTYGVDKKGRVYIGYDCYVGVLKHIIYTYPLGLLLSFPGISFLGKKCYAYFAENRLTERCTSKNCSIPVFSVPVSENEDVLIKGWNRLNLSKLSWKFIILVLVLAQAQTIYYSPFVQKNFPMRQKLNMVTDIFRNNTYSFFRHYLGITSHNVFLYQHFKGFNHLFKITYIKNNKEVLVPLYDNNGQPSKYTSGIIWRNLSFNVVTPVIRKEQLESGLKPYLLFFRQEYKIKSSQLDFKIYVKEIEVTDHWQKDFLRKQMVKPWRFMGECKLKNHEGIFTWSDKMIKIFTEEAKQ